MPESDDGPTPEDDEDAVSIPRDSDGYAIDCGGVAGQLDVPHPTSIPGDLEGFRSISPGSSIVLRSVAAGLARVDPEVGRSSNC
jgi:hypothetical protein